LEKRKEKNVPKYLLFLDYISIKAYESTDRDRLLDVLESYYLNGNLKNAIKSL
jgi:hypothetical protein